MLPFNNKTLQSRGCIDLNRIQRYNWRNYMNMENEHINDLWEDMDRLNALYEEMMWEHDSVLEFVADYKKDRIIIKRHA
ncbi:hypothetical protein PHM2_214 [Prochlorococcus phage P-HM2]|uniref:Uncharacterized protein n=1 Tax=Prochlorococcus phage P-HM2 TaxID=445696 RepID=E3ST64_9CAUD|nr:hypothetical protein PHM2_214 [Prochlorococcus phage P-HM2]ADO99992.1 hypothetical protein PHM2_214 [Prochlorococcus phage P-HM2]